MKRANPFPVIGYHGPELFCDREKETERLIKNLQGGINTTLISIRRMGKSALIQRVFEDISKNSDAFCLYIDLYPTLSIKDLTRQLATSALKQLPKKRSAGKKFLEMIKGLRPVITYDPLTAMPEVRFEYSSASDYEYTLTSILGFLEEQDKPVFLAFDEFQMVASYEEKNTEALLRSQIQSLKNINFIFSGSNKHMMAEIFSNTKRPFFASTHIVTLSPIPKDKYSAFIIKKFTDNGRQISEEAVDFVLEWTRCHTYYTQSICNALFGTGEKSLDINKTRAVCGRILEEREKSFLLYRNLLSGNQWKALTAVAKEQRIYKPQAGELIRKYSLGSPASSKRAFSSLLEKEMIYEEIDAIGSYFSVYDLFLSRWLEKQ